MNKKLTEGEKEVLKYVSKYKQINGFSPTRREIMEGIGTKSKQYIDMSLENLEECGYIELYDNHPRTILIRHFLD